MPNQTLTPEFLAQKTWDLYQTHGVPIEVSEDILEKSGYQLDKQALDKLVEEHQNLSRSTSAGQFKSGLGGDSEKTRKLHTSTHILHTALRNIFGENLKQMGSAITDEKARFDFALDRRITDEEVEIIRLEIQNIIDEDYTMSKVEMSEKEARELGAIGLFGEKYGDKVTVYTLAQKNHPEVVFSREFCGGPHVEHTGEIGKFVIIKQKSVGQGVKRLEFTVE